MQDIPLLVENGMAPLFPLVVVVHADAEERVRRLVGLRGMPEADARARIAAQADDDARRAAADVWLDNSGDERDSTPRSTRCGSGGSCRSRRTCGSGGRCRRVRPASSTPTRAGRLPARGCGARVAAAAGELGRGVAHIGSTAVPGLPAKDVIDLQLGVASLADADAARDALQDAGFPWRPDIDHDNPKPPGSPVWPKRVHRSADPGRVVNLHIREVGTPGWRYALLFRDWLRADARGPCGLPRDQAGGGRALWR